MWAAKRWREAGEQIELLYGERWREFKPLNDTERADILRAAIGYALGEETIGLARLREKYGAKFSDGPDRRAFEIVSAPIGTSGADFQTVAKKVASVDTLDAFLRDLRARYPESSAISPGGAAGNAPSAETAPTKLKDRRQMRRRPAKRRPTPRQFAMQDPRRCRRKPPPAFRSSRTPSRPARYRDCQG